MTNERVTPGEVTHATPKSRLVASVTADDSGGSIAENWNLF